MNIIRKRQYLIEMDVWEPLEAIVDKEVDKVVQVLKSGVTHAANIKITKVVDERQ